MSALPTPPRTTRRLTLTVGGLVLSRWTTVQVNRNLRDIAGSFTVQYRDSGREALAFDPDLDPMPRFPTVLNGQACSVALDGTTVLTGYIEKVDADWEGNQLNCSITGRDKTGDLVDCAASPNGPVEWRNLNTMQIAQIICKPFGISVRADVTIDTVFPVFGIDADETALSAIEKAARQTALLVVSDGGGVLLTRGGSTRAPAPLQRPGNIQGGGWRSDWSQRFSDYYVKGQTNRSVIHKSLQPAITVATAPSGESFPVDTTESATTTESVASVMTGHAVDPEVTRYRPTVRMSKTQSGAATVTEQAFWGLRIAKGMSETGSYRVLDWRAGASNGLWLPNAVTHLTDAYAAIDKDMLISGVSYRYDQGGEYTMIEVAGRTAFDRINEPASDPHYIQAKRPKSFGPTREG
jgi:prophage tail gpP-like protein